MSSPTDAHEKETRGAWVIHHGQKIMMDAAGAAEFPAIDQAAKATSLVFAMASSNDGELSMEQVRAIGRAARLNLKQELDGFLDLLQSRRLIERTANGVNVPAEIIADHVTRIAQREPIFASAFLDLAGVSRAKFAGATGGNVVPPPPVLITGTKSANGSPSLFPAKTVGNTQP